MPKTKKKMFKSEPLSQFVDSATITKAKPVVKSKVPKAPTKAPKAPKMSKAAKAPKIGPKM